MLSWLDYIWLHFLNFILLIEFDFKPFFTCAMHSDHSHPPCHILIILYLICQHLEFFTLFSWWGYWSRLGFVGFFFILIPLYFIYCIWCVPVCLYVHYVSSVPVCKGQKRTLDPLELEFQIVVTLMWVVEIELRSSYWTQLSKSALKHWATSLAL